MINIVKMQRRKRRLIINSYKFSEFQILKSDVTNFKCINKKCLTYVIVNKLNKMIKVANSH